jgi:protein TonB
MISFEWSTPDQFMKNILFVFLVSAARFSFAQQNELVSFVDDHGQPAKERKATLLIQRLKINDSIWIFNFYELYGPRLISFQSKDEEGKTKNGYFTKFRNGRAEHSEFYIDNQLVPDSVLVSSKRKNQDTLSFRNVNSTDERESSFPGSVRGWAAYLTQHLVYPHRAIQNQIQGKVVIRFIVDKDGNVLVPEIVQSVEYSLDQEALRLIRTSPQWKPAFQNGKNVKSYKSQPIIFMLSR